MTKPKPFEIIETRNKPKAERRRLDFSGTFEEAKLRALKEAKKNIGVRYSVFREGAVVADFQAYYRTAVKCPKCGEIIPLE